MGRTATEEASPAERKAALIERIDGRHWAPGSSGNPNGSKFGSRHAVARLLDELAEGEAPELFRIILNAAKDGDMNAAKIIADRIWPVRKGRPIQLDLPEDLETVECLRVIVESMGKGIISMEEAQAASVTIMAHGRAAEAQQVSPAVTGSDKMLIRAETFAEDIALLRRGIRPR